MSITLAMADDHPAIRKALAEMLETHTSYKVIIQSNDGQELLTQLERSTLLPDICILDLKMPGLDGIETMKLIRKNYPAQRILIYTMFLEDFNFRRIYSQGANGAISKEEDFPELINAIDVIHRDGLYIPLTIAPELARAIRNQKIILPKISAREIEFLRLYCGGLSQRDIGTTMNVSIKTVDTYRDRICQKLGISTRNGLFLFALKTGIAGWNI